jgi:homoserine kinase type II
MPGFDAATSAVVAAANVLELERTDLPAGTIHADLFRDNALFVGDELRGVVDFHYACSGVFVDDIAVAALDWCWTAEALDATRLAALCGGYESERPLTAAERDHFPTALVRAALRFWLSRRHDFEHPRSGTNVMVKDPAPMFERLGTMLHEPVRWPV